MVRMCVKHSANGNKRAYGHVDPQKATQVVKVDRMVILIIETFHQVRFKYVLSQ